MTQPHGTSRKIVSRFAPSPTGYLHIGGARTALFSWAYARRHGGTFILRIEDTDVARSTAESTRQIIEDMKWLGLDWDEGPDPDAPDVYDLARQRGTHGPYFQSQRGELYMQWLDKLRALGRAYRCFKSPEQLKSERERARAEKRPEKYDPTEALERSEAEQQRLIAAGRPFVWRFRMPESDITVNDLVLGDVTIKRAELEDFVIMKSLGPEGARGGGPTFHFANVVDDATMEVTHVLRAQEHLMNTPKHVAMFDAFGLPRPNYAHMPLIFNPDGTKMSKRDPGKAARAAAQAYQKQHSLDLNAFVAKVLETGRLIDRLPGTLHAPNTGLLSAGTPLTLRTPLSEDLVKAFLDKKNDEPEVTQTIARLTGAKIPEIDVHDFRTSGYLKDVLLNYVSLLGWSPPGQNVERFALDFLKSNFAIEGIGKSNARFDRAKLLAFNADTLAKLPPEDFFACFKNYLIEQREQDFLTKFDDARLRMLATAYQVRSRTLQETVKSAEFFVAKDNGFGIHFAARKKVLEGDGGAGYAVLREVSAVLAPIDPWEAPAIHKAVEELATRTGRPMGDIAQPIRVAVSGSTVSPPIDQTLAILGRASTLARIDRCLAAATK